MTLSTNVYILDKVDPQEVFDYCNNHLLHAKNPKTSILDPKWEKDEDVTGLENEPGQGIPAWLITKFRKSGEMLYPKDLTQNEYFGEDEESAWGSRLYVPACYMDLDFDTSYSYRSALGDCNALHAFFILSLYNWLKGKGVRIKWKNEYTGEIFDGLDGLSEFFHAGSEAQEWFRTVLDENLG